MDDLANVCAAAKERTHRSAPFSKPPLTFSFLERSTSSGRKSAALPTKMTAKKAVRQSLLYYGNMRTDADSHASLTSSWTIMSKGRNDRKQRLAPPKAAPMTEFCEV